MISKNICLNSLYNIQKTEKKTKFEYLYYNSILKALLLPFCTDIIKIHLKLLLTLAKKFPNEQKKQENQRK